MYCDDLAVARDRWFGETQAGLMPVPHRAAARDGAVGQGVAVTIDIGGATRNREREQEVSGQQKARDGHGQRIVTSRRAELKKNGQEESAIE
jgi:hypothetical protein